MPGKRFFSIMLLGVILLQCIIIFIWQLQLKKHHSLNWNRELKGALIEVSLSLSDFQKYRINDHEIKLDNRYYDIKKISATSTGFDLIVKFDKEEAGMIDKITNYFSGKTPSQTTPGPNLSALFSLNYFQDDGYFVFKQPLIFTELSFPGMQAYDSVFPGHTNPPPKG